ncbi:MAG: hypothetical protein ACOYMP_05580 [Nodosilinea sp.]
MQGCGHYPNHPGGGGVDRPLVDHLLLPAGPGAVQSGIQGEWRRQTGVQQCVAFDQEPDHSFWFHVDWDGKRRNFRVTVTCNS